MTKDNSRYQSLTLDIWLDFVSASYETKTLEYSTLTKGKEFLIVKKTTFFSDLTHKECYIIKLYRFSISFTDKISKPTWRNGKLYYIYNIMDMNTYICTLLIQLITMI